MLGYTPQEARPPPDGHCSERYTSYWNALLLTIRFHLQANIVVVALIYLIMLVLIGFSVYEDPVTLGIGLALFLGGIPLYFIFSFLRKIRGVIHFMGMCTFGKMFSSIKLVHK